jgi:hypothetical protein
MLNWLEVQDLAKLAYEERLREAQAVSASVPVLTSNRSPSGLSCLSLFLRFFRLGRDLRSSESS